MPCSGVNDFGTVMNVEKNTLWDSWFPGEFAFHYSPSLGYDTTQWDEPFLNVASGSKSSRVHTVSKSSFSPGAGSCLPALNFPS